MPNLVGFVNKNFSPMTSWFRDQQVPAKNVNSGFQIWTCSRTISKHKIQGQAKCQMAGVYTLPIYIVNMNHTMIKSGWMDQVIQRGRKLRYSDQYNYNKCIIVAIPIFSQFMLMSVPRNLENAPVQVLIQLRHWENSCTGVSTLIKLQAAGMWAAILLRDSSIDVFM